jgi:hypothetical protein
MTTHLICDATTWPAIAASPERFNETLAWLRANSIEPNDVPTDTTVTVVTTDDGAAVIRYEVYLRDGGGHKYFADADDTKGAAREWRTTPLTVLPPAYWWIDTTPEPAP